MFLVANPYNILKTGDMPEACEVCGQVMEPEPGYYYGSMYISYILGAFWSFLFFAIMYVFMGIPFKWAIGLLITVHLLLSPPLTRWARAIYLYLHVPFRGKS